MPEPIPVIVLRRLAVDSCPSGNGLGSALFKAALLRTLGAADAAGIRAILLHAISEDAKRYDLQRGVAESPLDPMTMMITLAEVEKALVGQASKR